VARSFSGDPKQLNTILKAAMAHNGTCIIDVISPCVTFNNHDSSTKSYKNAKDHDFPLHELGFVQYSELENVEIPAGESKVVTFPDGSKVSFRALRENHDPTDRFGTLKLLHEGIEKGEFLTGLLYVNTAKPTIHQTTHIVETPLVHLGQADLKPGAEVLKGIMDQLT
jgi:2-oxoglutarate ferredoxin oxidoreductase subunit beta